MPFKLTGASSGNVAEVDANKQMLVTPTTNPALAGYIKTLDSSGNPWDTSENGFTRVSSPDVIFYDQVDGSTVNTNLWNPVVSNCTIVQANGFRTLNAGGAITSGLYAVNQSVKYIPLYGTLPLSIDINAKVSNLPAAGAVAELGIGLASTTSAPSDGAFFRWAADGTFKCVINNAGSETPFTPATGTITDTLGRTTTIPPATTDTHIFGIQVVEDHVQFLIDDVLVADIQVPLNGAFPFNNGRQPMLERVYTTGAVSLAPQLSVGQVIAVQDDLNQNRTWAQFLCSLGRGAYQIPISGFGQTANHVNSTSPTSATLSNTAAGYTTLGGRFQFAAAGGAATDYALFAYQNVSAYQLFINNISISSVNTGATVAGTPTILDWALAVNSSAVSLATSDSAGVWSPRRIPLGIQAFSVGALAGAVAGDLTRQFAAPLVVDSSRYLHVILQLSVGTATASQIIRGDVAINGYCE